MAPRRSFAPVSRSYGKLLRRAFADAGVEGGELLRAILARDADAAELTKASAGSLQASSQWPRKWVCKSLAGHPCLAFGRHGVPRVGNELDASATQFCVSGRVNMPHFEHSLTRLVLRHVADVEQRPPNHLPV